MVSIKTLPLILNDANFLLRIRVILQTRSMFLTDHAKKPHGTTQGFKPTDFTMFRAWVY